jgi:hypothetical protein
VLGDSARLSESITLQGNETAIRKDIFWTKEQIMPGAVARYGQNATAKWRMVA